MSKLLQTLIKRTNYITLRSKLLSNSIFYISASLSTSVLGFLFWKIVTSKLPVEDVGIATVYISTASLISSSAFLGLNFSLIRFIPTLDTTKERITFINSTFATTGLTSIVLSSIFIVVSSRFVPELAIVIHSISTAAIFICFVVLTNWNTMVDHLVTGYRNGKYSLYENLIVNILKIPLFLIYCFIAPTSYAVVVHVIAISMAIGVTWIFVKVMPDLEPGYRRIYSFDFMLRPDLFMFSLPNYLASWLWEAPKYVLPLLVVKRFGAEQSAAIFIALTISSVIYFIGGSTGRSLFAEVSHAPTELRKNFLKALKFSFGVQAVAIIGILLLGKPLLGIYGDYYRNNAFEALVVFSLGSFGFTLSRLTQAALRVRRTQHFLVFLSSIPFGILLIAEVLVNHKDIVSYAWLWLIGLTFSGIMSILYMMGHNDFRSST